MRIKKDFILRTLSVSVLGLSLMSAETAARADIITTFTLSDVVFSAEPDNENAPPINSVLEGSFTYDVNTGVIPSWNMHLVPPFEGRYIPGIFATGICVGTIPGISVSWPFAQGGDSFNFAGGANCGALLGLDIAAPILNGTAPLTGESSLFAIDEDSTLNPPISGALIATSTPEPKSFLILLGIAAAVWGSGLAGSPFLRDRLRRP